jgi:hypothetical protein
MKCRQSRTPCGRFGMHAKPERTKLSHWRAASVHLLRSHGVSGTATVPFNVTNSGNCMLSLDLERLE